jgi:hypothetical protein
MNSSDITLIIFSVGSVAVSIIISLRCIKRCDSPLLSIQTRTQEPDLELGGGQGGQEGQSIEETNRQTDGESFIRRILSVNKKEKIRHIKRRAIPNAILV